jgi:AcrR family transcriptional regulator
MEAREQLLQAALKVYAESGTRGATTRRIAQEAGVNEVTLFRHFGSKEALIREALGWRAERALVDHTLPSYPGDPEVELLSFCRQHYRVLSEHRSIIRKCMGELEEHPQMNELVRISAQAVANDLGSYLHRLRSSGLASGDWNSRAAAAMLLGALFADVMGRDCMPERYTYSERDGIRQYVSLFLRGIGVKTSNGVRMSK